MGCINFMTINISIYSIMSKNVLFNYVKEGSDCGHEINATHGIGWIPRLHINFKLIRILISVLFII